MRYISKLFIAAFITLTIVSASMIVNSVPADAGPKLTKGSKGVSTLDLGSGR